MTDDLRSLNDEDLGIERLERRLEMSAVILDVDPGAIDCTTFTPKCDQLSTCGTFG